MAKNNHIVKKQQKNRMANVIIFIFPSILETIFFVCIDAPFAPFWEKSHSKIKFMDGTQMTAYLVK